MDYSEKLCALKVNGKNGSESCGMEIGYEKICEMLEGFAKREHLVYVKMQDLFSLFDDYCKEKGFPMVNHMTVGRVLKKHYKLKRKKIRDGKTLFDVYVYDEPSCI